MWVIIIKIDEDRSFEKITLNVLNPEDNSPLYTESRDLVATENDVKRLVEHFLRLVEQQKLAANLPRTWHRPRICTGLLDHPNCPPDVKIEIWADGDHLYERSANDANTKATTCNALLKKDGEGWSGTCTYV